MDIKKEKVPSVTRAPYNALNSISKGSYQETDRIGSSLSFIVIFIAFKSGSLAVGERKGIAYVSRSLILCLGLGMLLVAWFNYYRSTINQRAYRVYRQ